MAEDPGASAHDDEIGAIMATSPDVLVEALEANDRFRRDSGLGGLYHWGKISFRELARRDSLHVIIDGNRVSAHVDEISPLSFEPGGAGRYSLWAIVAHNVSGIRADIGRRLHGRHGEQRCNMECEVVWVDDEVERPGVEAKAGAKAGSVGQGRPVPVVDCATEHPDH